MSESDRTKIAVVVGVGPGLGRAAARRFAAEGYSVALMARGQAKLAPVKAEIEAAGGTAIAIPTDASDAKSVAAGFSQVNEALGAPDVLIYNVGAFKWASLLDIEADEFERCWQANCLGAFLAAKQVLPAMLDAGRGTVLLTGATASLRGGAKFSCLAVGKFGLRALAQSMAREFGPKGIHVSHVLIDGQIDLPRARAMFEGREDHTFLAPDAIADVYWHLHTQDRTCWTHELDIRPAVEKF